MAKLMDYNDTHITIDVCGTARHIAPEYLYTKVCSEKIDVFAYGIMLLELINGQRAVELAWTAVGDDILLLDWLCTLHSTVNIIYLNKFFRIKFV